MGTKKLYGKRGEKMLKRDREQLALYENMMTKLVLENLKGHVLIELKDYVDKICSLYNFEKYYSTLGRKATSPRIMFGILLLMEMGKLSNRKVTLACNANLLYRYFVGLKSLEKVPHYSSITIFKNRIGSEGLEELFNLLLDYCKELGLLKNNRVIDATHIQADISITGKRELLRQSRKYVSKRMKDKTKSQKLLEKYSSPKQRGKSTNDEIIKEIIKTEEYLKEVFKEDNSEEVKEAVKKIEEFLSEYKEGKNKIQSFVDEDARGGYKGPKKPFIGYKFHVSADPESGLITASDLLGGNENEGTHLLKIINKDLSLGNKIDKIAADKLYGRFTDRNKLRKLDIEVAIPNRKEKVMVSDFKFKDGVLTCSEGQSTSNYIDQEGGFLFYFSVKQCKNCSKKNKCLNKKSMRKRVYLSYSRKENLVSWAKNKDFYKKERYKIERIFGIGKKWMRLKDLVYRGYENVRKFMILTFFTMNLKRMLRLTKATT